MTRCFCTKRRVLFSKSIRFLQRKRQNHERVTDNRETVAEMDGTFCQRIFGKFIDLQRKSLYNYF